MPLKKLKLNPQQLHAVKPKNRAYKLSDSEFVPGLFCLVQPAGTKTFVLGFTLKGVRCEVTIGRFPSTTLAEARVTASAMREGLEKGVDPRIARRAEKAAARPAKAPPPEATFKGFAAKWQRDKLADCAPGYVKQVNSRLDRLVFPMIGSKGLADVKPADVLKIIQRLQDDKPNTAEGVRGIVQSIYNYAVQLLLVEANPATPMRGVVSVPKSKNARHLSPRELGRLWRAMDQQDCSAYPTTIAAARFLVYTMTRKVETCMARWDECDLDRGIWSIPAGRMKMDRPHRVFLPRQARELLAEQKKRTGRSAFIFSSDFREKTPIGANTLNHFFKRLDFGVPEFSPHGTRGTTATLLRELKVRRDVVELLLAHGETGTAAHYHHHELEEERAEALQLLADEIDRLALAAAAEPAQEEATA